MTLRQITSAVLTLALVGLFFNIGPYTSDFMPEEALGAANQATVEVLGGGGGGGVIVNNGGGGGGGGEFRAATCTIAVASYTVTVGAGGTIDTTGETDSTFTGSGVTITADGGNGSADSTAGTAGTGGSTSGCTGIANFNGGTPAAGLTTDDTGGGAGGGAGWGGKGGNATAGSATVGGGGGGGGGETAAGGNAGAAPTAGTGGTGGGGAGGAGGNAAVGAAGTAGTPSTYHVVGGGGGGGGDNGLRGGTCGAPGAGSGGSEVTGAGNGCRGEIRITYVDSAIDATGGTETTSGIYRTHTFTTSGTFTVTSGQSSPYVVLNAPADASTTPNTTPALSFTGTASTSDDIRYNLQIASASTFGNGVVDSFSGSSTSQDLYTGSATGTGQSFTGDGGTLLTATFALSKLNSPTGNATAYIYAHTGTFGSTGLPTGNPIATSSSLDVTTLTTTPTDYTFTFSGGNQITLSSGTKYVVTVEYDGGNGSNLIRVAKELTSASHAGNSMKRAGALGGWTAESTLDSYFSVGTNNTIITNAVSGTDAGFSGTPDNADPFTSAQQVTYTVQSALSNGTYYWRARGIDPNGTNAYGAWSDTRSFTVASVGGDGIIYIEDVYFLQ